MAVMAATNLTADDRRVCRFGHSCQATRTTLRSRIANEDRASVTADTAASASSTSTSTSLVPNRWASARAMTVRPVEKPNFQGFERNSADCGSMLKSSPAPNQAATQWSPMTVRAQTTTPTAPTMPSTRRLLLVRRSWLTRWSCDENSVSHRPDTTARSPTPTKSRAPRNPESAAHQLGMSAIATSRPTVSPWGSTTRAPMTRRATAATATVTGDGGGGDPRAASSARTTRGRYLGRRSVTGAAVRVGRRGRRRARRSRHGPGVPDHSVW